jgi:hypothetical protein
MVVVAVDSPVDVSVDVAEDVADVVTLELAVEVALEVADVDTDVEAVVVWVDALQFRKVPSIYPVSATLRAVASFSHLERLDFTTNIPAPSHDTSPSAPG